MCCDCGVLSTFKCFDRRDVHLTTFMEVSDKNSPCVCHESVLNSICELTAANLLGKTWQTNLSIVPFTKLPFIQEHPAVSVYVFEKSCFRRLHCTIVPPRSPPANQKVFLSISRSRFYLEPWHAHCGMNKFITNNYNSCTLITNIFALGDLAFGLRFEVAIRCYVNCRVQEAPRAEKSPQLGVHSCRMSL